MNKKKMAQNEYNVILFGLTTGMEFFLFIILSSALAISINMVVEYIVFLIVFTLLRSYAGGAHMSTYVRCLVCSCGTIGGALLCIKRFVVPSEISILAIGVISFRLYCVGPVDCTRKKLEKDELRIFTGRLRRTLMAILIVAVGLYVCNMKTYLMTISLAVFIVCISSEIQKCVNKQ